MYCPNCGNKNEIDQRFCRACGLALEQITQSLNEQLPAKLAESLQTRKAKLEKWGVAALGVFGAGVLGFFLYSFFIKLMVTQGTLLAGLASLALLVVLACGLLSVILFAKANEIKLAKREVREPEELSPGKSTKELPPKPEKVFSVTEHTTELLSVEKKK